MPLYLTEYRKVASGDHGHAIQAGEEPPLAEDKLDIGPTSVKSNQFHKETRLIMVHTDSICHVAIGQEPTASTENRRLPADTTIFYGLKELSKLAVIEGT